MDGNDVAVTARRRRGGRPRRRARGARRRPTSPRTADVELTLRQAEPDINEADVQDALDDFANPAVSGPVTLVFDDTPVTAPARGLLAGAGR